jgi:hypothetical protein
MKSPKLISHRLLQNVEKTDEAIVTQRKPTLQRDMGFDVNSSSEQSDPRSPTPTAKPGTAR